MDDQDLTSSDGSQRTCGVSTLNRNTFSLVGQQCWPDTTCLLLESTVFLIFYSTASMMPSLPLLQVCVSTFFFPFLAFPMLKVISTLIVLGSLCTRLPQEKAMPAIPFLCNWLLGFVQLELKLNRIRVKFDADPRVRPSETHP